MGHTTWSDYHSCQKEEVSDLSNVPVAILMNKQNHFGVQIILLDLSL